jgi:predicted Zn-ribbon and HTH transcriptional regulator
LSQSEVIKILEHAEGPLSVGEIARMLQDNQKKISKDINRMLKYKEVSFIEIDKGIAISKYKCKHRMRLYFTK